MNEIPSSIEQGVKELYLSWPINNTMKFQKTTQSSVSDFRYAPNRAGDAVIAQWVQGLRTFGEANIFDIVVVIHASKWQSHTTMALNEGTHMRKMPDSLLSLVTPIVAMYQSAAISGKKNIDATKLRLRLEKTHHNCATGSKNSHSESAKCDYCKKWGNIGTFFYFYFSELCWGKAMVAYTKPLQWKKEESERDLAWRRTAILFGGKILFRFRRSNQGHLIRSFCNGAVNSQRMVFC